MIKLCFFDIDGTLIPFGKNELPESARNALIKLNEKGIKTFVATGKSLAQLTKLDIMDIPFSGFLTLNGQLCYNEKMQMIFGYNIDPREMEVLERIFLDDQIPFSLIGEFSRYINFINDEAIKHWNETNSALPDIGKYKGERIYQITAFVTDRQREVLEKTLDYCSITSWAPGAIDIFAKGGGKMNAIKHILDEYEIKPEECMAFGDAENDVNMLKYCGIGVALGNGTDACKAAADYVTTDINDNGVENALKHFGII